MNKEIIEKLADYEHDRWSRWQRQINTPYCNLTESEKDSDRKEAIRIINIINEKKEKSFSTIKIYNINSKVIINIITFLFLNLKNK